MRHIITYLILLIGITYTHAMPIHAYDAPATQGFRSHKILSAGTVYQGTTYTPFDNSAPSEYSEVGQSYSPNKAPGGPRKAFDTGAETGRDDQYPIGEPWILALFAAAFAGVILWKRRKAVKGGKD